MIVTTTTRHRSPRGNWFDLTVVRESISHDDPRVMILQLIDPVGPYPAGAVVLRLIAGPGDAPRVVESRWAMPPADLPSAVTAARAMLRAYR